MSKQIPPNPEFQFDGVHLAGHPLERPPNSSVVCENFRIMPGFWPRLRSGRKARMYQSAGSFQQFIEYRNPSSPGWAAHAVQHYDGSAVKWKWLDLELWDFNPFFEEPVSTAYDGGYGLTNTVAACRTRNKIVVYNGLGVRDATNSRPPFSSFDSQNPRYFGLDAYHPGGSPAVAFVPGLYYCSVISRRKFYVGLCNTATGHYSNGVYAGEITTNAGPGLFRITGLDTIKTAYHNAGEQNELRYVFYVTLDGDAYGVPYLLMNAAGTGPYTVATTETQADLNFIEYQSLGGIYADVTQEMPTENFPPRPMRKMTYVNGRIYGIPLSGGSGTGVDFNYVIDDARWLAGIVYSAAASDMVEQDFVGNPEESWPLANFSPTPNAEIPLQIDAAPDGERVLVITPTATFLVKEDVDGLHEWRRVSAIHGIGKAESLVRETPYGAIWVTQRNQIAVLPPPQAGEEIQIISRNYQTLLSGKTVRFAYYVLDPLNEVDQYRVVFSDGTCVVHDFALGGSAYTATNHDYTVAGTLTDRYSVKYHLAAKQHVYTHEGQPEDGLIVTGDEDYTGPTTKAQTNFTGTWTSQWKDFGDSNLEKELPHLDVIGDEDVQLSWYADQEQVSDGTEKRLMGEKAQKSDTDNCYRFKLSEGNRFWYKFKFSLQSNYQRQSQYRQPGQQDDMKQSLYGAIARVLATVSGAGGNRP